MTEPAQAALDVASEPLAEWEAELLLERAHNAWLVTTVLRAAYPAHDPGATAGMRELPHDELVALIDRGEAPATFVEMAASRLAMAERVVAGLLAALAEPEDDEPAGPPAQLVHTDTLRRWAVLCDQITEEADQRRRLAANGSRFLADDIRREIAHPADQPGLAAELYRDEHLFDHDRTPSAPAGAPIDDAPAAGAA